VNSLRPPPWSIFKARYLLLLALGAFHDYLACSPELWMEWDEHTRTIEILGLGHWHTNDISQIGFPAFWYQIYNAAILVATALCVTAVVLIYGPKRFFHALFPIHPLRLFNYAAGGTLVVLGLDYVIYWIGIYPGDPVGPLPQNTLGILYAVLAAPIIEELIFRLAFFQMLRSLGDFLPAAALSSTAFGLMHLGYPDPAKIIPTTLFGLVACWAYEKTGSILTPIALHMCINTWAQFI